VECIEQSNGWLVGARGFEPPTSCSQSRRATGLRYAPTREILGLSYCKREPLFIQQHPWTVQAALQAEPPLSAIHWPL
jgi:hypothetical protein